MNLWQTIVYLVHQQHRQHHLLVQIYHQCHQTLCNVKLSRWKMMNLLMIRIRLAVREIRIFLFSPFFIQKKCFFFFHRRSWTIQIVTTITRTGEYTIFGGIFKFRFIQFKSIAIVILFDNRII